MTVTATISASGDAPPDRVWRLLSCPAAWPAWAPHMRHISDPARYDGAPASVHVGQRLRVHSIVPRLALPVTVTEVTAGRSWEMRAELPLGAIRSGHVISTESGTTTVTLVLTWTGPRPLGVALLAAYRPVAAFALRRLLHLAATDARGAAANALRMCLTRAPGDG